MIDVKIIADSLNPAGVRLTTAIWTYPKFIHGEVMTHRALSKNASSSRAIPTSKMLKWVKENPAMPITLEPWLHMTTLISGTDWANLFVLRVHPDAQPEFQRLAYMMLKEYVRGTPKQIQAGEYHIPFSERIPIEYSEEWRIAISVGRCARVSYVNQNGNYDPEDDITLHDRLIEQDPGHWTPTEHVAMARDDTSWINSNFRGFTQYRKMFPKRENITDMDYAKHLEIYESQLKPEERLP